MNATKLAVSGIIHGLGSADIPSGDTVLVFTFGVVPTQFAFTNNTSSNISFLVSGAPSSIMATDHHPLNGFHTVEPNSTIHSAVGTFHGDVVSVANYSDSGALHLEVSV